MCNNPQEVYDVRYYADEARLGRWCRLTNALCPHSHQRGRLTRLRIICAPYNSNIALSGRS
jgi:hypothetical protein